MQRPLRGDNSLAYSSFGLISRRKLSTCISWTLGRVCGATIDIDILDTQYLPLLFATARGPWLKNNLPFMAGTPRVRHDGHYYLVFR